jgi:phage-related protein
VKTIILTLSAAKDLDALPRDARAQVEAGLHRYAMTGQGDLKALQHSHQPFRRSESRINDLRFREAATSV